MASIAGLGKIGLPRQEQLQYVLCNLDTENFSEELRGRLSGSLGKEET